MASAQGRARCKSNLIRTRALTPDSCPRPLCTPQEGAAPSRRAAAAPAPAPPAHLRGAPGPLARGAQGPARVAQLCKPRLNSPRPGGEPLPRSPLPVPTSLSPVHFPPAALAAPEPGARSPAPPPEHAVAPGTPGPRDPGPRRPARRKRRGGRTIPRRGAHNHRCPDRGARGPERSAPPALRAGHTSPHLAAPGCSLRGPPPPATLPRPPPRAQPFPEPPSSARAQEAPPRPPPRNPQAPRPLTAAQRPAAAAAAGGGGRRPGAQKLPDLGEPGRTPYLGGRRGEAETGGGLRE